MKQFINNFNNFIKKTILKLQNKTNNNFQISNFNKYLITFISLLFFYLFYLSIPILYGKIWIQSNIEKQLLKEFKINFSISSDISYRILPAPHFLIKDSKIFKKDSDKIISLADVKNLKVFISQSKFFDKKKMTIRHIKMNNANFSLLRNDLKLLKNGSNNSFSKKIIEIHRSNVFFKDNRDEAVAIIKIKKARLFQDSEDLLNVFNLDGEVYNIPFSFVFKKNFDSLMTEEISIISKTLKLNIYDIYNYDEKNINTGKNVVTFLNNTVSTKYKVEDKIVSFNSADSKIKNNKIDYNGELSINPFNLNLNINLGNYKLLKLLNINSILNELIKTELLFNKNISINTLLTINSDLKKEIFNDVDINFNIINGKINFDKTKLINKKIGSIELENSNLNFINDRLILNTNIIIDIKNHKKLFSLLQTNKRSRKPIKNILINLDYDFLTNQIGFNNFKIDNKNVSEELSRVIQGFNDNNFNNWNKSKRFLNILLDAYEG